MNIKKHKLLTIISSVVASVILISGAALYITWDFLDIRYPIFWKPTEPTEMTIEPGEVVLEISTPQGLIDFSKSVNGGRTFEGETVVLGSDIDMKGFNNQFEPIGGKGINYLDKEADNVFKGTFEGNGHTIKNLSIKNNDTSPETDYNCCGLFGVINNACIRNLTISDSVIEGTNKAIGGIVGSSQYSIIENCCSEAKIVGYNSFPSSYSSSDTVLPNRDIIGGIVGFNLEGVIKNCYNTGTIDCEVSGCMKTNYSDSTVGGIAGINYSKQYKGVIRNCYNAGQIIAKGEVPEHKYVENPGDEYSLDAMRIGGIAGENYYIVENCYNIGTFVTEHPYAGIVSDNGLTTDKGNMEGGTHITRVGPQPNVRNCYYLSETAENGIIRNTKDSPNPLALTAEEMKSDDFLNKLNDQASDALKGQMFWTRDDLKNEGYPTLIK